MTHRAEQIVDAVVDALQAATAALEIPAANVFAHRALTLAENQGELPAVTVTFEDDEPTSEFGTDNIAFIDSLLTVQVKTFAVGDSEQSVKLSLMAQRRQVHVALMADPTLSLDFVMVPRYGGAAAPEIDASTEAVVGSLETTWRYLYRMNIADPG